MSRPVDLTGLKFGRLTAIRRYGKTMDGKTAWLCRCECGTEIVVALNNLRSGGTRSCGCLRKEAAARAGKSRPRNNSGDYGTPLYQRWNQIKSRCHNPNVQSYRYFGARGITVDPEWSADFQVFKAWALANGYQEGLWLIRKDKTGPYSPDNCKWVRKEEVGYHGTEKATA